MMARFFMAPISKIIRKTNELFPIYWLLVPLFILIDVIIL